MVIEVDEKQIENMQEDLDSYVSLIKKYDQAIKAKNELIGLYEKELRSGKTVILLLIQMLKSKRLPKEQKAKIEEIEKYVNELEY
jgi:signal transduction histidine kinase